MCDADDSQQLHSFGGRDLMTRAPSRGASMQEGDFASLLLPGHTATIVNLGKPKTTVVNLPSQHPVTVDNLGKYCWSAV